jgi:GNAT superfamily N-acetyltransferase
MSADAIDVVEFSDEWAADFAALNYEWIETYFAVEQHDREILDNPRKYVIDLGGEIFMAVVDGQAAGTAAMIPANDEVVELTKMAVSPLFHRLGLASKLMVRCIEWAEEHGFKTIFLETNSRLSPALSLYRKFGFTEVPGDPDSLYTRADVRMERQLRVEN